MVMGIVDVMVVVVALMVFETIGMEMMVVAMVMVETMGMMMVQLGMGIGDTTNLYECVTPIDNTNTSQMKHLQVQGPSADFFIHPDTMLLMRRLRTKLKCEASGEEDFCSERLLIAVPDALKTKLLRNHHGSRWGHKGVRAVLARCQMWIIFH